MITLTFREFVHGEDLIDFGTSDLELYIVRNKNDILYIGMARYGIYRRWFGDPGCHMNRGSLSGNSHIGVVIYDALPHSVDWNMDLFSPIDVLEFLEIEYSWDEGRSKYRILDPITESYRLCDIKYLESIMIRYLYPHYNSDGNNFGKPNEYFLKKYLSLYSKED